jgi:pyruvate/2-oxoglutarate dehydrogenase complex dihydrolipoamide acyltransferase (E2) component
MAERVAAAPAARNLARSRGAPLQGLERRTPPTHGHIMADDGATADDAPRADPASLRGHRASATIITQG